MGFTRDQLLAFRNQSVPDLVDDRVRLLFAGINPGLWTAATQAHFARPGNRFYPALYAARLTSGLIDATGGLSESDATELLDRGIGITNLVNRATATAAELTSAEMISGATDLRRRVELLEPRVVAMLGIGAYRVAFQRPKATRGWQDDQIGPARLYIAGNPSGLNAHETVLSLAGSFREVAIVAGISPHPPK